MKAARRVLKGPRYSDAPGLPDRDLRPVELHRKISSCLKSQAGAQRFARVRSYLSTTHKHDIDALDALTQLFAGRRLR